MERKPYLKLKGYFASKNILNKEVAEILGITPQSFSAKINRSGQDFTKDQVAILCKKFKLDANEFFLD